MSTSQILTRGATQRAKIQTRAMVNKDIQKKEQTTKAKVNIISNDDGKKSTITLTEAKKKGRNSGTRSSNDILVKDIYQNALSSLRTKRGATGLVFDKRMADHSCLWDKGYPECPERFTRVIQRCDELKLIDRCQQINPRPGTRQEILKKHTKEQYDILKATDNKTNEPELEELSSHYDAIYIHPTTFQLSKLAVGSTIELVDSILRNEVQNGMAIIRPPGHHAMKAEYNGYCFFNNVAIAAQHALDNRDINRILIVDYDVHHGQGTQRMFYNDPRVLYFSIHRYEHGTFWPNLRESDFDCIGEGKGLGYNFNLPLNKTGMTNADYLAIWQQILLPVAAEYQPNLIIISAGYDAAFGCPEGEMEITPACYAHLVSPLMALASGRVAVVLEGGYCLDSLAEGAAITLKTLLGDPCPLIEPLVEPCTSIQESIMNCIYSHRNYWKCLQVHKTYERDEIKSRSKDIHLVEQKFIGSGEPVPERFETRNCYPVQSNAKLRKISERLRQLRIITNLSSAPDRVCYVYDSVMAEHRNLYEDHYERPERITKIKEAFTEYNLLNRMHSLKSREATTEELCLIHTQTHVKNMLKISTQNKNMQEIGDKYNSIYFHEATFKCATMAVGSVLEVVDNVLNGSYQKGICVVRPPGHHAEAEYPHGFCIFNNVALAAKYAIKFHGLKRVLIVDWDIHHGNGTQRMFENDDKVLYMSLHRYEQGDFFPKSTDGNYTMVGEGRGKGYNVNIPWNKHKMGDSDYIAAFQRIVMPIAYEFNPELVIVSAGFDAVVGDPIGHYNVTPEAYGYFTHWLSSLANGNIILCLEGGYNVNSISHAMTMCTKALLGDPLPMLHTTGKAPSSSCIETIQNVCSVQQKFWKSLRFNKKLPAFNALKDNSIDINEVTKQMDALTCSDDNNPKASGSKESEPQPGPSSSQATASNEKNQTLTEYLQENRDALLNEDMFAVVPLSDCPHLATLSPDSTPDAFDTKSPCQNCETNIENWVCLLCYKTYCSRYVQEHMLFHHIETEHALALSYSDLSVWCFKCENYIDNPLLFKYKNLAHRDKFGEEMVWCYDSQPIILDASS